MYVCATAIYEQGALHNYNFMMFGNTIHFISTCGLLPSKIAPAWTATRESDNKHNQFDTYVHIDTRVCWWPYSH